MRLAIVGSREFNDYDKLCDEVAIFTARYPHDPVVAIVSGGARGADTLARLYAAEFHLEMVELRPDWKQYGKRAGLLRNNDIVESCTHMIAFPSHGGSGTQDSIRKARAVGKPVHECYID